jgi:hypothetical protein
MAALLAGICVSRAQEPREFSLQPTQIVQLPGTGYRIAFNSPELQVGERRDIPALAAAIASWLSINFGLPAMRRPPHIEYIDASDIAAFLAKLSAVNSAQPDIPSAYDCRWQTAYLPRGWNGGTPDHLAAFVREMVHHLQNESGQACRDTPEDEAFTLLVQERWRAIFSVRDERANAIFVSDPVGPSSHRVPASR